MENKLFLASKSLSRQKLLNEAQISYKIIEQNFDESEIDLSLSLKDLTISIAIKKMNHVILPNGEIDGQCCFILTADTLGQNINGNICRKPISKQDAIGMIKSYRQGAITGTAFCLDKKICKNGSWCLEKRIVEFVSAKYIFDIPDHWIETYFQMSIVSSIDYMQVSGAVAVEEFGAQFLKIINGSYTTIVGLPMYELRTALEQLGFFNF